MEKLRAMARQMKEATEKLKRDGRSALEETFAEIFRAHPTLYAIRWRQYTPYFNDGNACTFGVREHGIKLDSEKDNEKSGDYEDGFGSHSAWQEKYASEKGQPSPYTAEFKGAATAVDEVFSVVPDELMLAAFGDHAVITVTKDQIEVEQYEHD